MNDRRRSRLLSGLALAAAIFLAGSAPTAFGAGPPDATAPIAKDWADLGKLPDWSGVWTPDIGDQNAQIRSNPTPWTPDVARQIAQLVAEEQAGRPKGLFVDCLPEGMPSWMLISHNALEILFTPGRVTMLGESDGNRLRRIYTDGRPHPDDPDLTFHGDSVGHWEGDTLVVDTKGVLPQSLIAVSEAVGVPNNGDMHIAERIRLKGPDILADELTITAPHVLTRPWTTTRLYNRNRGRDNDIVEGVCLQGGLGDTTDENGNAVFKPLRHVSGIPVPDAPAAVSQGGQP
jgi:hypothetical protein